MRYSYGAHGFQNLEDGYGDSTIQFNLAHSHELTIYAFSRYGEIGVDLEYISPIPDVKQIAVRFFSPRENAWFQVLPESHVAEAFFNCWTRKEAIIKAIGDGLTLPLDQFDVSLVPGEPARLLVVQGDSEEAGRWWLKALKPAPGYTGALAIQGHGLDVRYWQWSAC